ncbi:MAG: DNA repair protein RecN [Dethiobacteria bacterium]|nr:DNA repair protein RecN [Bacillota bacterium]
MLVEIRVSNFALIEDLTLRFKPGLNVLSGETGAGKSIIIGAINLLLGERAATDQIRQGEEGAFVEGIFEGPALCLPEIETLLEEAGIENGETLIVAREISRNGRSVGRVNGRAMPIFFLKELGGLLVDLHGQHQHQSLLRPGYHLELLDLFGGERAAAARRRVESLFRKRQELRERLAELGHDSAERERRMDILSFQINEIREARPDPDEEERLLREEKILAHAEKLKELVAGAYNEIYRGDERRAVPAVLDALAASQSRLEEAAQIDPELAPLVGMLESASAQLEEISFTLRDYQAAFEYNPAELAAVQKRLEQLRILQRKYGETVAEVIAFGQRAEEELNRLQNSESLARELEEEIAAVSRQLEEASCQLSSLRREAAAGMEPLLESALQELALPGARFTVCITEEDNFTVRGRDRVEFLFSANPGEEVKPLAKIISGGEMSRVMLAIKTIFAGQERIPTLIFDEVDAGIGGAAIQAVAEKLALLAVHHQIICVTHSPQIAAMADHHVRLYKELSGERTQTRAEPLNPGERRAEIARMLDGAEIDQAGLQHVDSLLGRAERFKKEARSETV